MQVNLRAPIAMLKHVGIFISSAVAVLTLAAPSWGLPLSPGDRIKISIPEGEEFNGTYEVNLDGNLDIPYLPSLPVVGLNLDRVKHNLTQTLLTGGFFQPSFLRVSVNIVQWAPVEVFVSGATFVPGRVLINEQSDAEKTQPSVSLTGQYATNRSIVNAIRSAGGVKPNADVKTIQLIRAGQTQTVDLSGVFSGEPFEDVPLIAGDRIIVPDSGHIHNELVRPSQLTPVGIKIFMSNLTVPATSNATSSIGQDARSFPYGSRFSHAVVAANCAGGTKTTNAGRRAILVTTNQLTGQTKSLERRVDDILKKSVNDVDNPFLMSNDVVACYDSNTTQARDVIDTILTFLSPFSFIKQLLP
jgi:polysaccharide biosynthesis/export protein